MRKIYIYLFALAVGVFAAAGAEAGQSSMWIQADVRNFYQGDFKGVSLSDTGTVQLGYAAKKLYSAPEPFFWSVLPDGKGGAWVGTGNKAIVYQVSATGQAVKTTALPGVGVTALAPGPTGGVLAAGFPGGDITRIDDVGTDVVATLPCGYVWQLLTVKGNVFAACGSPAGVYRIEGKNKVVPLLRSPEKHILSLARDPEGNIYAGSGPNGIIYRVDTHDRVTVYSDLDEEEVYRLAWSPKGALIAAANSRQVKPDAQQAPRMEPYSFPLAGDPTQPPVLPAEIYQISADGAAKSLAQLPDPYVMSLVAPDARSLILGTANKGRMYFMELAPDALPGVNPPDESTRSLLQGFDAQQILEIKPLPEGGWMFVTGNPAALYKLDSELERKGEYTSGVNDTGRPARWGMLDAGAEVPEGAKIAFQTRTGNTALPDETWSDWSASISEWPAPVKSPGGRYIQYRATLSSTKAGASPVLRQVSVAYLNANRPPELKEPEVYPKPISRPLPPNSPPPGTSDMPQRPQFQMGMGAAQSQMPVVNTPENNVIIGTVTTTGEITVQWKCSDPDNDQLRYEVELRSMPGGPWTALDDKLTTAEYRLKTESIPDGLYQVRVRATDAPSNPRDRALSDAQVSSPFYIDNTRPRVVDFKCVPSGNRAKCTVSVADDTSLISAAEYSLDNLDWNTIFPDDQIFDGRTEKFTIDLVDLQSGSHTVYLRARDFVGNIASAEARFKN